MDAPFTPNTFYKFAPAEKLTTYKDSYGRESFIAFRIEK